MGDGRDIGAASHFTAPWQLSIGIIEKHVNKVHKQPNQHDEKDVDADLNIVFACQSSDPLQQVWKVRRPKLGSPAR